MGPSPWNTPFVRVAAGGPLAPDVEPIDHVVYERGWAVAAERGTEVLAWEVAPYFNRDHLHFSSHAQTPPSVAPGAALPADSRPAATRRGQVVYFSHPLARAFQRSGSRVYRQLLANAVDLLLPERLVSTTLPAAGQVTVLHQPEHGSRLVVHLLYYLAERRAPQIDIVEDPVTLRDVRVTLRPGFRPRRVYEAPSGDPLDVAWDGKCASVTLPQMCGHAMVVFEP